MRSGRRRRGGGDEAIDIKSNNPHLAGGRKRLSDNVTKRIEKLAALFGLSCVKVLAWERLWVWRHLAGSQTIGKCSFTYIYIFTEKEGENEKVQES